MNTASTPILRARDVSKAFAGPEGEVRVLDGVELEVGAGESVAIVGASGSGKTTLLGLFAGLDLPNRGSVAVNGSDLNLLGEEGRAALRAQWVGFVFQSFHLLPSLNALENVMLPLELAGRADAREAAQAALDAVSLSQRARHYPPQLSGGEQQRVALARAFVKQPRLLFADEPTGNLDRRTGAQIGDLLFQLNAQHGTTLILVSHDLGLASRCQRRYALEDGRLTLSP